MDPQDQKEVESLLAQAPLLDTKELDGNIETTFKRVGSDENISAELSEIIFYILSELSDNIEQHSRAGHFSLLVEQSGNDVILFVVDDGLGIPALFEQLLPAAPEDDRQKIKDALKNGVSTKGEGRGYGLRTVREMVLAAGGKMVFVSGGLGYKFEGSRESEVEFDRNGTIIFIKLPESAYIEKEKYYRIIEART